MSAMDSAAQVLVGRHDFSAFGGKHRTTDPDPHGGAGPQEGSHGHGRRVGDAFLRQMVRSIVAALLRIGHGTGTMQTWRPRCGRRGGSSPGRSPRRTGCASGGSSLGEDRPSQRWERHDMTTRTYTPRAERDRAPVVRRRRGRRDPGSPRHAHRDAAGGQAQAHACHPPRHRRPRHRGQRRQDRGHGRQAGHQVLRAPQRLSGRFP